MSPIGLLILLILIINNTKAKSSLNFTQYELGEILQVLNGIVGVLDVTCPPGEYEGTGGECNKCVGYDGRCYARKECCGLENMYCDFNIHRCNCEYPYIYSKEHLKCVERITDIQVIITMVSTFIGSIFILSIIYACRHKTTRHKDDITDKEVLLLVVFTILLVFGFVMPTIFFLAKRFGYPQKRIRGVEGEDNEVPFYYMLIFIVIVCIVMPAIGIWIARHKGCFKRIRERREARRNPTVQNLTPDVVSNAPTEPIRPGGYNGLSDILARQYTTRQNRPTGLTIAEVLARQQSTDSMQYTTPSPESVYPPPQYVIPPQVYAHDLPPEYNDIASIPVSPPPEYDHVVGFQFPNENS